MKKIKFLSLLVVVTLTIGCASGAKMENMVYTDAPGSQKNYDRSLKDGINVASVAGGTETNPLWTSEISTREFSGAVKKSLANAGLLADAGRYELRVTLLDVDQPSFGINFEVTTHVRYVLTDKKTGSVVFNETLVESYTATMGDAFLGVTRLRMANEGSARKSIQGLLDKLAELKIKPGQVSLAD